MNRKIKKIIKGSFLYPLLFKIKNRKRLKAEKHYELILSNVVGGKAIVEVTNIPGIYELDLRSDILRRILVTKEYEPEITAIILDNLLSNEDAINIGANIGLFTNLLANNTTGKVLAIEPTTNAYNSLERNISMNNNQDKVITFKGIVTDQKGIFSINTVEGKEEYSSIGNLVHDSIQEASFTTEEIEGISLDELVEIHGLTPKLLVIDVEGAESKVLQGGKKTLEEHKPTIISELDDELLVAQNTNSKEVINALEKLDYSVKDVDGSNIEYPFTGNIIAKYKPNN